MKTIMKPERWEQVVALYRAALERDKSERGAFLAATCAADEELRQEVESLLAQEGKGESFLEKPAMEVAAREFSEGELAAGAAGLPSARTAVLGLGATISHYRIISKLGAGGMGLVYEAEDLKLGRHVALKFLPSHLARDRAALERFKREAHAASALDHPNICVIHDVDESEGRPFIVMERLNGETLKHRLSAKTGSKRPAKSARRALPLDELLDLAIEIADALDAAHAHGIIHRDIKPTNIFITTHGQAKVLDFGLAKLTAPTPAPGAASSAAAGEGSAIPVSPFLQARGELPAAMAEPDHLTSPGVVMGTIAYVSREQARGEEVDARTDLFSFGVVLYEMATGQRAFGGEATGFIFAQILKEEPVSARSVNPEVPAKLDEIISKCLEKDRKLRYQVAADIRADLKRLKRDVDSGRACGVTAQGEPKPAAPRLRFRWTVAAATLVVIVLSSSGWLFFSRRTRALKDKDTIILADFTNTTGDPLFDGTLRQGLAVQLEQSPFLSLVPEGLIQQTLRLMGQPPNTKLTREIARELCQRVGSKAMLTGSITQIGTEYSLIVDAVNCSNAETLASAEVRADSKNHVLNALSKVATEMRGKLGESLSTVQKLDTPLERATTPSLEALQAYSLGRKLVYEKNDEYSAAPLFQQAIKLDRNFAMAYAMLGVTYWDLVETTLASANLQKAFELRASASEREQLYINAVQISWRTCGRHELNLLFSIRKRVITNEVAIDIEMLSELPT